MAKKIVSLVVFWWLFSANFSAQDFILQGCCWACPEERDSLGFTAWSQRLRAEAPKLAYAGFTYLGLPAPADTQRVAYADLLKVLRKSGLEPVATLREGESWRLQVDKLQRDFQIKNLRLQLAAEPDPATVAQFINESHTARQLPLMLFYDFPEWQQTAKPASWLVKTTNLLSLPVRQEMSLKVYDYPLREALRRACTDPAYDVRQVYERSLRDATALTGFDVATLVNHSRFQNQNGKMGDWDDPIFDPMLAYAYLLTNNQLGLPTVFYRDYFGSDAAHPALRAQIDQLLRAHRACIVNSTAVEYLNASNTDRESVYLSAAEGVDASRALVFQLNGANTPAGRAGKGRRDVIVAVNFANKPLRLVQEINMSNVNIGDIFTDILKRSEQPFAVVMAYDSLHRISNAIYLEVPPRSYALWVQGEALAIAPGAVALEVESLDDYTEITWDVPPGYNNKIYEIEKSVKGSEFVKIATVEAVDEQSVGASYLYLDEVRLPEQAVAYRLKMVDERGTATYTAAVSISPFLHQMSFELTDSGQPGVKIIRIKSNFPDAGTLALYNAKGEKVLTRKQPLRSGLNTVSLNLSHLPSGVYFVKITTDKQKQWSKKVVHLQ